MQTVFCLVVVLSMASLSLAAVRAGNYADFEYPKQCVINEDYILVPGKHKDETTKCGLIWCYNDGTVEMYTCPAQDINKPGFQYGDFKDPKRSYPQCCERVVIPIPKPTKPAAAPAS